MATKENVLDAVGDRVRDRSTGTQNQILEPAFDDVMREMVRRGAIRKAIRTESTFAFVAAQRVYTFTDSPATGMGLARVPEEVHSIYVPAWGADEDQVFIDHRSPRAFEVEVEETGGSTTTGRPYIWRFTAPGTGIEVHKVPTSTYADGDYRVHDCPGGVSDECHDHVSYGCRAARVAGRDLAAYRAPLRERPGSNGNFSKQL